MALNTAIHGAVSLLHAKPWIAPQAWQWQPVLDVHDPNPPITLEDPVAVVARVPRFTSYPQLLAH